MHYTTPGAKVQQFITLGNQPTILSCTLRETWQGKESGPECFWQLTCCLAGSKRPAAMCPGPSHKLDQLRHAAAYSANQVKYCQSWPVRACAGDGDGDSSDGRRSDGRGHGAQRQRPGAAVDHRGHGWCQAPNPILYRIEAGRVAFVDKPGGGT